MMQLKFEKLLRRRESVNIISLFLLGDATLTLRREAAAADFYEPPLHGKFAKLQILPVEELFEGKKPHMPWIDTSVFRKAKREATAKQGELAV
jgi:site-specific DNA-methyltransferase (adenine-specific)